MPNRLYCLCETANLNILNQQSHVVVGTVWSGVMVEQSQTVAVLQALFNFSKGHFFPYKFKSKLKKKF